MYVLAFLNSVFDKFRESTEMSSVLGIHWVTSGKTPKILAMAGGVSLAGVLQLTGVYPLMRSLQSLISLDTSKRSFRVETLDGALRAGF